MRRSLFVGAVTAAVAVGGMLPAAVSESGAASAPSVPVVVARMAHDHITLVPNQPLHAGRIDFHVVSTDGKVHNLQIVRLHKGYSITQAFSDLGKAFSGDVPSVRRVDHNITLYGGARATATKAGDAVVRLPANHYLLLDTNTNTVRQLTVVGEATRRVGFAPQGSISAFSYGFGNITQNLPAHGLIRLYNHADQPHFFVFSRVKDSTTPKQVRQYFSQPQSGPPSFGLRGGAQAGVLSPRRGEVMSFDVAPGKYLVQCFWPDYFTGMPHAFMGMWKLVRLH